ncbi:MAG: aldose epimerase family protein [Cyclobacteriaceae bacterium]
MIRPLFLAAMITLSCSTRTSDSMTTTVPEVDRLFHVYELQNKNGLRMKVTNFGGRIMELWVPDREGKLADIVLGYDSAAQYINGNPYLGALIGRFANRITRGRFSIDDQEYQLNIDTAHALHGGPGGFHNVFWRSELTELQGTQKLELYYLSRDGEEGYPGNLKVTVTYSITDENELVVNYEATTDQTTIINLTQHCFFHLAGAGSGNVSGHQLQLMADRYCPVDDGLIPTGVMATVAGTPFDFTQPHAIGERIGEVDPQLRAGRGYDHTFVLNKPVNDLGLAAVVTEPGSGRVMEVWTTEPGLQFYSGNFLDGSDIGKGGRVYVHRSAFCLEAQHFPDSPNQPGFPTTELKPGETYRQKTIYRFSVATPQSPVRSR